MGFPLFVGFLRQYRGNSITQPPPFALHAWEDYIKPLFLAAIIRAISFSFSVPNRDFKCRFLFSIEEGESLTCFSRSLVLVPFAKRKRICLSFSSSSMSLAIFLRMADSALEE